MLQTVDCAYHCLNSLPFDQNLLWGLKLFPHSVTELWPRKKNSIDWLLINGLSLRSQSLIDCLTLTFQILIDPAGGALPPQFNSQYSETCIIRPPLGLEKGGLYLQVVFIFRFILHIISMICFEIVSLRIQVVFLDSGHILQVSLY